MIYKNMELNQGMESIGHDNYVGKYKTLNNYFNFLKTIMENNVCWSL